MIQCLGHPTVTCLGESSCWNLYCLVPFLQNSLVIDTPRVRKQTRPFSATKDELAELSEGESDSDETKPKLRRNYDRLNSYGRTECFRVEKNLLVYGWDDEMTMSSTLRVFSKLSKGQLLIIVYLIHPNVNEPTLLLPSPCFTGGVVGRIFSNMGVLRSSWQSGMWNPSAGPCCLTAWSITVGMTKSKALCGTWLHQLRTDAPRSFRIT